MGERIEGVGISNPFYSLVHLKRAFYQAEASLSAGAGRNDRKVSKADVEIAYPCYFFEKMYVDYLLLTRKGEEEGLYNNCSAKKILGRFVELQSKQNYDYIGFLYIYLLSERRPSIVGRQLHLHRNTVIYHIHKVEDALGCSLEDPQLRLKLILEITHYFLTQPLSPGFENVIELI